MEINQVPDVQEFEKKFLKHRSHLMSYLYRMLANREESEDICSQSYLKARENLATFRRESSLKTWFFAVATHLALDLLRDRKRWKTNAQDQCRSKTVSGIRLLQLRTRLIGSLNPIHGQGSDFHEYLYRLIHRQEE